MIRKGSMVWNVDVGNIISSIIFFILGIQLCPFWCAISIISTIHFTVHNWLPLLHFVHILLICLLFGLRPNAVIICTPLICLYYIVRNRWLKNSMFYWIDISARKVLLFDDLEVVRGCPWWLMIALPFLRTFGLLNRSL